jgi:DNA-binding transcriptional ArsR family regulator
LKENSRTIFAQYKGRETEIAKIYKALGHPLAIMICEILENADAPLSVTQIAENLYRNMKLKENEKVSLGQLTSYVGWVSQHVRKMKKAGVVESCDSCQSGIGRRYRNCVRLSSSIYPYLRETKANR